MNLSALTILLAVLSVTASVTALAAPPAPKPGAVCPFAWNASPDANVAGYNLYAGTNAGVYTQTNFVGNVTNATLPNLFFNVTNYVAATTVDTNADGSLAESDYCPAVTFYTNSPPTPLFNFRRWFK